VSDVYSLGATLYFLLTGRPPFQTASTAETIRQVIEAEPVAIRRLNPAVSRDLETICLKCLRKEPAKRYATAADLAADLGRWLENKPIQAHPVSRGERAWLWCKRRPAVAVLSAAVVIISVVGSLVAVERQNSLRATGLVESLVSADVAQVPQIMAELENHRGRVTPMLVALAARTPTSQDERRAQLHARLALVTHDEQQVDPLVEELLAGHVSYVGVVRDQLVLYQERIDSDLWDLLHDATKDSSRRFRAGLALATHATTSHQWTAADYRFLAEQLLTANPEHQPRLRQYLRPLDDRLLGDLERTFADSKATESHQLGATNALADVAAKGTVRLARLLSTATPGQYEILYPLVVEGRDAAVRESLIQLVREVPAADLPQLERVALGQRRAGAAITLLRQGDGESMLDVLRGDSGGDPESLTQFIHRCRDRGISLVQLLDGVKRADVLRQTKTGAARRTDDGVLYALLLALGEFEPADLPESQREALVEQLAAWHAADPSSAIHAATGWLLRHWKRDELARKVDQTPARYDPDHEWFTLEFVVPPTNVYITFVVFPAGEYLIGSPPDEADRLGIERPHRVRLTRPIAVGDREITWRQIRFFDEALQFNHHDAWEKQFGHLLTPDEPAFGVNWFEAVSYCRWLTAQAQMPESDQCYADQQGLDKDAEGYPKDWPLDLDRRGFRLPTEAEWEIVGRSGTSTAYSFGNDAKLLGRYGWVHDNSDKTDGLGGPSYKWSHAVGELRPGPRGMFDMHGNLDEWCHDWYREAAVDAVAGVPLDDPTGPPAGPERMSRGGAWGTVAAGCRTAHRGPILPNYRSFYIGFRVAVVPFSQNPN